MLKRVFIGAVGLPCLIFIILNEFQQNIFFFLFLLLLNILALNEIHYIFLLKKIVLNKVYFILSGLLMIIGLYIQTYYIKTDIDLLPLVFLLCIVIYFITLIFNLDYKDAVFKIGCFSFGLFYISYLSSYFLKLKTIPSGSYYLFLITSLIWLNDSFAYFIGMFFGKRKLSIKASPNKSYAGVMGGLVFSIIAVFLAELIFPDHISFSFFHKIVLGIIFGIIVVFSDLLESVIKRSVSIKDSKGLLPGHGGVLDIFDGWLITIPLFYYYIVIVG